MIGVTDRAKQQLKKILFDNVDMPQAGIRLVDRGGKYRVRHRYREI